MEIIPPHSDKRYIVLTWQEIDNPELTDVSEKYGNFYLKPLFRSWISEKITDFRKISFSYK